MQVCVFLLNSNYILLLYVVKNNEHLLYKLKFMIRKFILQLIINYR